MPDQTSLSSTAGDSLLVRRQTRLQSVLAQAGLQGMALNPGPSLVYLTGLHFHLMERPVVFLAPVEGTPVLILPELELAKVQDLSFGARIFSYSENPATWQGVFRTALLAADISGSVGVEPTRMRYLELKLLEAADPQINLCTAEESTASLRMYKDEAELDSMRKAVEIAQQALLATLPIIQKGISERELASELTLQLLRHGSDSEVPFAPIVSAGANSANPHATPTDRRLVEGDLLVIDWGATYQGYISDLTRTFAVGAIDLELKKVASIVEKANFAGRAAAKPGATAGDVDSAARKVIEDAGYGKFFTHRTGHGIGMEGHEPPYIRGDSHQVLEPGMTFTIEPGIYLTGRNGVRIEDNLVITENGSETLSSLPRELRVIDW